MSKVLERLSKKYGHPVTIGDETFHVRPLTIGEWRRSDKLESEQRTGFIVGCALCDGPDANQEIPKGPEEDDASWAARVLEALADVPSTTITQIINGISIKTPSVETITKN